MSRHFNRWVGPLRAFVLCALLSLGLTVLAVGCGDDDDDGKKTPTTRATATADAATDFKIRAKAAAAKAEKETETLLADMQAAQLSQADPKWPGVLTTDADLVIAAANALKALTPAATTPPALSAGLQSAATRLAEGADILKRSITSADQTLGLQAFAALSEGLGTLKELAPQLE
jgi:hypothetical protein